MFAARDLWSRIKAIAGFRPSFLKPIVGLERGLTDPIVDLNMGQTAEILAHVFHISRRAADEYAVESQHRSAKAQKEKWFAGELEPAFARNGKVYDFDDGVRPDGTVEKLAELKPAFERPWGKVTAGNSSQITDGASWVILASEDALKRHGLAPRAMIVDSQWSALDPSVMGLGPVLCSTAILRRRGMTLGDVGLWELNEAFAAQVLSCLAAWQDDTFCREILGLDGAAGLIPRDKLNVDGGAIGLGHPVGASGNRIVLHLVNADAAARRQAGHRHAMHRWRAGRCHADRDRVGAADDQSLGRYRPAQYGTRARLREHDECMAPLEARARRGRHRLARCSTSRAAAPIRCPRRCSIEFNDALEALERDLPKGLVIRSAKPAGFIAGADIGEFGAMTDVAGIEGRLTKGHAIFDRLDHLGCPTVAVVHGYCLGGGLELVLACKYRIALDDARFGFPEVMLGLHPGLGGTVRAPRLINPLEAMTMMLTGRTLRARRARSVGLVDAVTQERHVRAAVNDAVAGNFTKAAAAARSSRSSTPRSDASSRPAACAPRPRRKPRSSITRRRMR